MPAIVARRCVSFLFLRLSPPRYAFYFPPPPSSSSHLGAFVFGRNYRARVSIPPTRRPRREDGRVNRRHCGPGNVRGARGKWMATMMTHPLRNSIVTDRYGPLFFFKDHRITAYTRYPGKRARHFSRGLVYRVSECDSHSLATRDFRARFHRIIVRTCSQISPN